MSNQKYTYSVLLDQDDTEEYYSGIKTKLEARSQCQRAMQKNKLNYAFVKKESLDKSTVVVTPVFRVGFQKRKLTEEEFNKLGFSNYSPLKPTVRVRGFGECHLCGAELGEKVRGEVVNGELVKMCEEC